jgi:hypothetical protein
MLRKGFSFRNRAVKAGATADGLGDGDAPLMQIDEPAGAVAIAPEPPPVPFSTPRRPRITRKRIVLALGLLMFMALGSAYTQKDTLSPKFADYSRNIIGDENTARVESYFFRISDRVDKLKYKLLGGETNPFAVGVTVDLVAPHPSLAFIYYIGDGKPPSASQLSIDSLAPLPLQFPKTIPLRDDPQPGEGVWSTAGLPHNTPTDTLMAKTFVRPDKSRPYALVGALLMDSRRIRLHMTAGVVDPGGFRGVKGPGVIPQDALSGLLAAWNGGFKGPHGNFGMYADGTEYVPLRNGLATVCVSKDGTIKMGEWGNDIAWDPNFAACRQNVVPLVVNGEVSSRTGEGNDTWGYVAVNSAEFITWRSALGLTKDGNLIYAAGNSLSAETLARALWAEGAYTAMQLDINSPYVLLGMFFPNADGSLRSERFMDSMPDSPSRFLRSQDRDFMWVTLDESRYR